MAAPDEADERHDGADDADRDADCAVAVSGGACGCCDGGVCGDGGGEGAAGGGGGGGGGARAGAGCAAARDGDDGGEEGGAVFVVDLRGGGVCEWFVCDIDSPLSCRCRCSGELGGGIGGEKKQKKEENIRHM